MRFKQFAQLLVAAAGFWSMMGQAQDVPQPHYAVVSLIGDSLTVVSHQPTVGSRLDRNLREVVPLPDDTFDASAVFAVGAAVKRLQPAATTQLYSIREPKLFQRQDKVLDLPDSAAMLAEPLKPLLAQSKATHLILVSKHHAGVDVRLFNERTGTGKLSGIGFYVDPTMRLIDGKTGNQFVGFFSPYAYLKITLFDADLRPLRQVATTSSHIVSAAESKTTNIAWDVMTAAQKVKAVKDIIGEAVDEAMPKILAVPAAPDTATR